MFTWTLCKHFYWFSISLCRRAYGRLACAPIQWAMIHSQCVWEYECAIVYERAEAELYIDVHTTIRIALEQRYMKFCFIRANHTWYCCCCFDFFSLLFFGSTDCVIFVFKSVLCFFLLSFLYSFALLVGRCCLYDVFINTGFSHSVYMVIIHFTTKFDVDIYTRWMGDDFRIVNDFAHSRNQYERRWWRRREKQNTQLRKGSKP